MRVLPLGMYILADPRFMLLLRISQSCRLQREQFIMLLLLLLSLAIRVYHLGFSELIGDEGFSYLLTRDSYAQIAARVVAMGEPHPLGSYFIFKAWSDIAGISEFALRFPSAWFGVVAVGLIYRLGHELGLGGAVSIAAALFMSLSPFGVLFSREMRMYSMLLALTIASTLLAWILLRRCTWRVAAIYVLVSWLALNVHYYAGFVLLAQNLFVFVSALFQPARRMSRMLVRWVVAQLGVIIASLPWLIAALSIATGYTGNLGRSPDLLTAFSTYVNSFVGGQYFPWSEAAPWIVWLSSILIVVGLSKLWMGGADSRLASSLLVIYLFVPLLLAWANGLNRQVFSPRYAIAALGPLYLIVAEAAWGHMSLRGPIAALIGAGRAGAGLLLVAAALAGLQGYLQSDRASGDLHTWRKFIHTITHYVGVLPPSSVRVALNFPDPVFVYYHHRYLPQEVGFTTLPPLRPRDIEGARMAVQEWREQGVARVLLQVVDSFWDGQGIATDALASEFAYLGEIYTGRWDVKIYGRPGPGDLQPLNVRFVNGTILRAAYARVDLPARLAEVYFSWDNSKATLRGSEKFFVHVSKVDDPFALIGQRDEPLASNLPPAIQVGELTIHGYGIRLSEALPHGRYYVRVGLYYPDTPDMPRLLTTDGRDFLVLASFSVGE
jgi:hypothetical protein